MDIKDIKNLMKEFEKTNIHDFELEIKDFKLRLKKEEKTIVTQTVAQTIPQPLDNNRIKEIVNGAESDSFSKEVEKDKGTHIKAPLVGTYYAAPSPDAEPFVRKGMKVTKGQVLCIIEAMKVMNEITAPCDGVIKEIIANDAQMVEFDQVILTIE